MLCRISGKVIFAFPASCRYGGKKMWHFYKFCFDNTETIIKCKIFLLLLLSSIYMASKTIFSALSNDKRKSYEALKNCLLLVMQKIAGIRIGLLPQLQQSAGIWDAASWKLTSHTNRFTFGVLSDMCKIRPYVLFIEPLQKIVFPVWWRCKKC